MYIDAIYNSTHSTVQVVERNRGQRVYREHPGVYELYIPDSTGKHRSIHGEPLKLLTARSHAEFARLRKMHSHHHTHESDLRPVNRVLERHYLNQQAPQTHNLFFDIETAFDAETGYSQPEDAHNAIISVAVHLQWLGQTVCLAVPPDNLDYSAAKAIADQLGCVILYENERAMLDAFLTLCDDADIISGWNSEGYDIPYVVNRIFRVMGRAEARRLCLWDKMPTRREYTQGGRTSVTYDLVGRVHLDYLQLYKKFTYEERHSYSLDNIAQAELGSSKVPYDGTLDQLYRQDFQLFLEYNIQDTELLDQLDRKLQYIDLASSIAHANTVLIPASLGAVAVTEQAIINEAHRRGMVVPDRVRPHQSEHSVYDEAHAELEQKAAGGWVQHPKAGLHQWVGSMDLNSLYPSVIRALNMSPETIVAQIRTTRTDTEIMQYMTQPGAKRNMGDWWNDRFHVLEMQPFYDMDNSERLDLDFADGTHAVVTGAELRQLVFNADNHWCISANGTIFRTDTQGVVPSLLERWYAERKTLQAIKQTYQQLAVGIVLDTEVDYHELSTGLSTHSGTTADARDPQQVFSEQALQQNAASANPDDLLRYMRNHQLSFDSQGRVVHSDPEELKKIISFWDKRQLVKKINLNSAYGGLLNVGCRFYDKRLGQSTTLTGRSITRHMTAKTNELIDGVYDHEGRAVIGGDTDSVYFSAYPTLQADIDAGSIVWDRDTVVSLYDTIADSVSDSFADFVCETFNVPIKSGQVLRCGREVAGVSALFTKKKRYAILVFDEEGVRHDVGDSPGKLKITGLDIRRSDTPKRVQEFLRDVLMLTLTTKDEESVIQHIRQFKTEFAKLDPWHKGMPKAVNNLSNYMSKLDRWASQRAAGRRCANPSVPGHVMASINWNNLRQRYGDHHSMPILDGQKVVVCYLQPHNDLKMRSVAYPVDEPHLPDWFVNLPFDTELMEATVIDKKLHNLLSVLSWDLARSSPQAEHMETLFDFG